MDNYKKFRYNFFGDLSLQSDCSSDPNKTYQMNPNQTESNSDYSEPVVEDSLMEFIADYFQGEVTNDFSCSEYFHQPNSKFGEAVASNSLSEGNSSMDLDLSTSLDTSNTTDSLQNVIPNSTSDDSQRASPSHQRKSISYEIRFTNSKDRNGGVKIQIVPSRKSFSPQRPHTIVPINMKTTFNANKIPSENELLRQRVHDLERKLRCVEAESERVVGELTRIIERKNEAISHLELQIAGIKFMNHSLTSV